MSSKVTGWVWDQCLPIQRKCVLLWLAERATDNGVCFPGQAEIRQKTGLSESMVRRYLHWLASDHDEDGQPKQPLVRIIQRPIDGERNTSNVYVLLVPWAQGGDVQRELEELKHIPTGCLPGVGGADAPQGSGGRVRTPVGSTGAPQMGGTGDTHEPSLPDPDRSTPPLPPVVVQQPGDGGDRDGPNYTQQAARGVELDGSPSGNARDLVAAFYRGLGADSSALTVTMRRRDLAIARQLVDAGASAAEAESYARETCQMAGRIAPIDLRSFERERLGWLARRRGADQVRARFVDRTGQPPSWQLPVPETLAQQCDKDDSTALRQRYASESLARGQPLPERLARPVAAASLADTLRVVLLGHTA